MAEYRKAHSVAKRVVPYGEELSSLILETMAVIANVVGGTLGPGGRPVLIERPDDLPPVVTKDGVTVFKALGFPDSVQQAILESTREAAVRTANEAGDGTTTATILAEALVRLTREYCAAHERYSPNLVVRELEAALQDVVVPRLEALAVRADLEVDGEEKDGPGRAIARAVARVSANGDEPLADVVMQCYDICGDEGNVTLAERIGVRKEEVEAVQGYPVAMGYEDALGPFYTEFLREPARYRTVLKHPLIILYHGEIREVGTLEAALTKLFGSLRERTGNHDVPVAEWGEAEEDRDILLMACGFSDSVLQHLTVNWKREGMSRIFPLMVPLSPFQGGRKAVLEDVAAVTGADVYDPVTNPFSNITFQGVGAGLYEGQPLPAWRGQTEAVEIGRVWSTIFGYADPTGEEVLLRVEELRAALSTSRSKLETQELSERIARLAGGVARLTIVGTSNGDTKERKDRAEDAICAVKGALRRGALYGGGWALLQVAEELARSKAPESVRAVLVPALRAPFTRLLENVGVRRPEEVEAFRAKIVEPRKKGSAPVVFDARALALADPRQIGLYDSLPAVVEAVRSSLSIAALHGTMGGAIVQVRDRDMEVAQARAEGRSRRMLNINDMQDGTGVLPSSGSV